MHKFLFYNKFIIFLYMFRALLCSSSGGQNCIIQGSAEWTPIFQKVIKTKETSYRKKLFIFEKYLLSSFFPH